MLFSLFSSPPFLFSLVLFSFHTVNGQPNLTTFAGSQTSDSFGTTLTFLPATISNCADTSNTSCEGKWFPTADKAGFGTMGKGTTAVFKFKGPYAEFYGHKLDSGAGGTYTVDSSSTPIPFTSKDPTTKDTSHEGLLFTVSNLDPSKEHTIEVAYDDQDFAESGSARKFLSIINILYQSWDNLKRSE
ncbi:hypothetical protein DL96DRAFT_1247245 [Flagelloscypha sp. PMI_526]|nr:hypothetical protein DL96DRAFT_1247245 [Flagelloscypha sp. PMI_526]